MKAAMLLLNQDHFQAQQIFSSNNLRRCVVVLRDGSERDMELDDNVHHKDQVYRKGHIAFGVAETVGNMVKGGKYTSMSTASHRCSQSS